MFTNKITRLEEDIHREQIKRTLEHGPAMNDYKVKKKLSKVYDSIQKQFKVNIRDLGSLKRERATVAHHRRRTVEQQIEQTSYKKLAILTCLLILNIKMFFMLLSMNSMLFMGNRIEYHHRF